MNDNEIYCPRCKSTSYAKISAHGSEYASLVVHPIGSVYPNVCLNCGIIYLDRYYLKDIRKEKERKQKNMKW